MVVEDKDGVVNDVPDPREVPPDAAEYQLIVPLETAVDKSTVPVPQFEPSVTLDIEGIAVTAALTETVVDVVVLALSRLWAVETVISPLDEPLETLRKAKARIPFHYLLLPIYLRKQHRQNNPEPDVLDTATRRRTYSYSSCSKCSPDTVKD